MNKNMTVDSKNMVVGSIFCDGACSGNGTARAVAGWAWAYWPGEASGEPSRFGSARLAPPATNQRAELMALLEALRWWRGAGGGGLITIYTDSMYAINCTTKWGPGWRRKGWKRDTGEPLQNLDLIQPLVEIWSGGKGWRLVHVRGHQRGSSPEAHGNNWVDRAAVAAAQGTSASILEPPPAPVAAAAPKPTGPPAERTQVRQTDIRAWFGVA